MPAPAVCECEDGYAGIACDDVCPGAHGGCSGHGVCLEGLHFDFDAACACDAGWVGVGCELACPRSEEFPDDVCSGRGECVVYNVAEGVRAACDCAIEYEGDACERVGGDATLVDVARASPKTTAGFLAMWLILIISSIACACIAQRRAAKIQKYEQLLSDFDDRDGDDDVDTPTPFKTTLEDPAHGEGEFELTASPFHAKYPSAGVEL
jgi:hypothetical protein